MSGRLLATAVLAGCCLLALAKNYPCPPGYSSAILGGCRRPTVSGSKMVYNWNILKDGTTISSALGSYGILVLNSPLKMNPKLTSLLWRNAAWRITVDGGTDKWFDYLKKHGLALPLPEHVTGDFDSIKPETLDEMRNTPNVSVVETPDQDFTDFEKALNVLFKESGKKIDSVFVLTENGGRLDQTISNINTLSKTEVPIYLAGSSALTWLLNPGTHHIHIPEVLRENTEPCGLLPFQSAKVKTDGFKWDLDNWMVEYGGLISSSNTYNGKPVVTITTDKTIIWTMSVGKMFL